MMLSHSYQVTSKKRMSLHQKSRKMLKYVSTLFSCGAAARLTNFPRCAAMSSTRSRVVAATASTSRTALFPFHHLFWLLYCHYRSHAGNDSEDSGPLGPQQRQFPEAYNKIYPPIRYPRAAALARRSAKTLSRHIL